jgi:EamA domain-containing membrane protein RarD
MTLTSTEFVLLVIALGLAAFVLRRHVPTWVQFAGCVGFAIYGVFRIVKDGPRIENIGLVALFLFLAVHAWLTDLRGTRDGRP